VKALSPSFVHLSSSIFPHFFQNSETSTSPANLFEMDNFSFDDLPSEICHMICTNIKKRADLKNLRLTTLRLGQIGREHLFANVYVEIAPESLDRFAMVASDEKLSSLVRTLSINPDVHNPVGSPRGSEPRERQAYEDWMEEIQKRRQFYLKLQAQRPNILSIAASQLAGLRSIVLTTDAFSTVKSEYNDWETMNHHCERDNCIWADGIVMSQILSALPDQPRLTHLRVDALCSLRNLPQWSAESITGKWASLKSLEIFSGKYVSRYSELRYEEYLLTQLVNKNLSSAHCLTYLKIETASHFGLYSFLPIGHGFLRIQLPQIKRLHLHRTVISVQQFLDFLERHSGTLKEMTLGSPVLYAGFFPPYSVFDFFRGIADRTNLTYFDLWGFVRIGRPNSVMECYSHCIVLQHNTRRISISLGAALSFLMCGQVTKRGRVIHRAPRDAIWDNLSWDVIDDYFAPKRENNKRGRGRAVVSVSSNPGRGGRTDRGGRGDGRGRGRGHGRGRGGS
jgi:hypothetical protein